MPKIEARLMILRIISIILKFKLGLIELVKVLSNSQDHKNSYSVRMSIRGRNSLSSSCIKDDFITFKTFCCKMSNIFVWLIWNSVVPIGMRIIRKASACKKKKERTWERENEREIEASGSAKSSWENFFECTDLMWSEFLACLPLKHFC